MPLYNIPLPKGICTERPYLDYTKNERHGIWLDIRTKYRMYQGNILPAFYVSTTVFLVMMDSENFKMYNTQKDSNKVGSYDGGTVYISRELDPFEYYIGIEEREILHYKRFHKLTKIINRMNHVL